jgi:O-antigen/teichoic acid export membrane protein
MTLLLWVIARPVAASLGMPEATAVIRVLALSFVVSGLSFVPIVSLRKRLRYDAIAGIWAASTLAGALCSVALALAGAGYLSIVAGQVVGALSTFL